MQCRVLSHLDVELLNGALKSLVSLEAQVRIVHRLNMLSTP